jgi:hypothetical protein
VPRINLHAGDSGDLPVTFAGDAIQQAVTFTKTGVLTLSTTGCHIYIYDTTNVPALEVAKVVNGAAPRSFDVLNGHNYDVIVAGTTNAQTSGVIHYAFA